MAQHSDDKVRPATLRYPAPEYAMRPEADYGDEDRGASLQADAVRVLARLDGEMVDIRPEERARYGGLVECYL